MINYTFESIDLSTFNNNAVVYTWLALPANEVGQEVRSAARSDRSFQVDGNFDGATVIIEGSNDGITYYTLTDPYSAPLSFSSAGLRQVTEATTFIRPRTIGGVASAIKVTGIFCYHP